MEFKKLELEDKKGRRARYLKSPQIKKTLIAISVGALVGFLYF